MNQDKIIERIDQLLKLGQQVSSTARTAGHLGGYTFVDEGCQVRRFLSFNFRNKMSPDFRLRFPFWGT